MNELDAVEKVLGTVLLIGALGVAAGQVNAEGLELEVHTASYHTDRSSDFNENNLGLGISYPILSSKYKVTAGFYDNSYDKNSTYAGVSYGYDFCNTNFRCELGVTVGVITGYDEDTRAAPIQPLAVPQFTIGYKNKFVRTRFIPALGEGTSAVFTLSIGGTF